VAGTTPEVALSARHHRPEGREEPVSLEGLTGVRSEPAGALCYRSRSQPIQRWSCGTMNVTPTNPGTLTLIGVAKVVDPHLSHPGTAKHPVPDLVADEGAVHRFAAVGRGGEHPWTQFSSRQPADERMGQIDPAGLPRPRRAQDHSVIPVRGRAVHGREVAAEVQVSPLIAPRTTFRPPGNALYCCEGSRCTARTGPA
jgi:hypothetical protein